MSSDMGSVVLWLTISSYPIYGQNSQGGVRGLPKVLEHFKWVMLCWFLLWSTSGYLKGLEPGNSVPRHA